MKHMAIIFLLSLSILSISAIQVSGNQSGTWTVDNNPYQIIGDVTVPTGTTLTVQPGVYVEALGNFQITAEGNIIAVGTESDSIKFVSGQADPTALWKGIRLENTTVQSQFSYCRIDLGDYGINSINSPVSITYSHFKNNKRGIQAYGIGSADPAAVLIDHNLIELTIQNGILVAQNSNTLITNNEVTRNGTSASYYGAIQLSNQSAGGSNSPEIAYNHIHHNYKQGIIAWDIVAANAIMPEVHHNLIENNLTGIYFRNCTGYIHHNTIQNNFIPGDMNSGAGVMVSGATAEPYFEDNIVTGNYTGFYLTENAQPCLGNLMIYHAWAQGGNQIYNNIDANNVMHSVYCYNYTNSAITVSAENNFWDFNTAAEIAGTIEDNYDNPSLPTIDFDPWQNNAVPVYLTGTVTSANPPVDTATLELVSAETGNVLDFWTVNINEPFSVPVYHDSLVYIVAHMTDLIEQQYYGAYGGTENPTATQIIADVQFSIGELPISTPQPNWHYKKVGTPIMINSQLTYPLEHGWFVYAPTVKHWLYRDGDYLKINRYSLKNDTGNWVDYDIVTTPIWKKIANLSDNDSWIQFYSYEINGSTTVTASAMVVTDVTYFYNNSSFQYQLVNITSPEQTAIQKQLYDERSNSWHNYDIMQSGNSMVGNSIIPDVVEPDGTLFPLQTGNRWKYINHIYLQLSWYFGYKFTDNLDFYWIPSRGINPPLSYRLYDNSVFLTDTIPTESNVSIPLPEDGILHTYTISTLYPHGEFFYDAQIVIDFTSNQDEIQPVNQLLVYPNPFNPAQTQLVVKSDFANASDCNVAVYNLKGQLVWNRLLEKGATELTWDGRDNNRKLCASGIYQIVLTDGKGRQEIRKVMLIR
ncbi:MAG: right-handed parallel beta-helix repeat-containing protein [Candidatus Cloacimonadaceae bacterium]